MTTGMDERERIARENLETCTKNFILLPSDWARQFINSIRDRNPKNYSVKVFNKLHEITEQVKGKMNMEGA